MSGHSKWSTIKRKKGAIDAKRVKKFTKIIKEIIIAAKEGGGDRESNARLRLAIQNAKGANMPKENIDRAIKKATSADAESFIETSFEGYGPCGVAVFVECLTDNNNRTVASVRSSLNELGIEPEEAGLKRIPNDSKKLDIESARKVLRLIDTLEDDDDIQFVYHNLEMTDELAAELG